MNSRKAPLFLGLIVGLLVAAGVFAAPGAPNFSPAIFGDGAMWGTKGTTPLPAPNENNMQSYDKLFVFPVNYAPGQLPVSEAAPGNTDYNGGRWAIYAAVWAEGSTPVLLKSYSEVMYYVHSGDLVIAEGAVGYLQCPLLPVK